MKQELTEVVDELLKRLLTEDSLAQLLQWKREYTARMPEGLRDARSGDPYQPEKPQVAVGFEAATKYLLWAVNTTLGMRPEWRYESYLKGNKELVDLHCVVDVADTPVELWIEVKMYGKDGVRGSTRGEIKKLEKIVEAHSRNIGVFVHLDLHDEGAGSDRVLNLDYLDARLDFLYDIGLVGGSSDKQVTISRVTIAQKSVWE
jgi:hypothetical protein